MKYKTKEDILGFIATSFEKLRETTGALKAVCFVPELNDDGFGIQLYKMISNMEDHFRVSESFVTVERIETDKKNGKDFDIRRLTDALSEVFTISDRLERERRESEHEKG